MNITQYYSEGDRTSRIYRGRCILQKGYTIVDADEPFYRYVGTNSGRPFPVLVHPEEAKEVENALANLNQEQRLIFRLLGQDGNYRYVYGVFQYNGRVDQGFPLVEVQLMDIMRIHHKFDEYARNIAKYRKFMTLSTQLYFEYLYKTDEIFLYEYIDDRSIVRFHDTLANLQQVVSESKRYSFRQKAELEGFQEALVNMSETMELEIDGEIFGLDCGYIHVRGAILYLSGVRELMVASLSVTGEVKKEDKYYMSSQAFDTATSVYNKRAIKEIAMDLIANSSNKKILLGVMDIDDFKNINDTFGHMVGDEVIAKVAENIKITLGTRGYVGRFGGDEFMVVLDKIQDDTDFSMIFKTVRKNVAYECRDLLHGMEVTLSIGVATFPDHASGYEGLFRIADKCLYIAKAKGKDRVIFYKPEVHSYYDMQQASVQIHMPMSYSQSCNEVTKLMKMGPQTAESLAADVEHFLEAFRIDRMVICEGDDCRVQFTATCDKYHPEPFPEVTAVPFMIKEEMRALYDENGILARNGLTRFQDTDSEVYNELTALGVTGFIAAQVKLEGHPELLVMFYFGGRTRKWGSNETGLINIAAWNVAERYLRLVDEKKKNNRKEDTQ